MNEAADIQGATISDLDFLQATRTMLASLSACGAPHYDPVRWRFIESMTRRAASLQGSAAIIVQSRIRLLLADFQNAMEFARVEAIAAVERMQGQCADGSAGGADLLAEMNARFEAGDFRSVLALGRKAQRERDRTSLGSLMPLFVHEDDITAASAETLSFDELLRKQEQDTQHAANGLWAKGQHDANELRAMRQFREAWAQRTIDKAVTKAMDEAPENAGPLNAHLLIIRAITQMQTLSPDYLNRFVSYIDTLLWLEQAASKLPAQADNINAGRGKSGRTPPRKRA